jgi:hypothetical protein
MTEELVRVSHREGNLSLARVGKLFEELAAARAQAQKAGLPAKAFARASAGGRERPLEVEAVAEDHLGD